MTDEIEEVVVATTAATNHYLRAGYRLLHAMGMTVEARRHDNGEPYIGYAPRFLLGRPAGVERYVRPAPPPIPPDPNSLTQRKKRWKDRSSAHFEAAGKQGHIADFYLCPECWPDSVRCGTCAHPVELHSANGCDAKLLKAGKGEGGDASCPCAVVGEPVTVEAQGGAE